MSVILRYTLIMSLLLTAIVVAGAESLYNTEQPSLFTDRKAHVVGDLLTIIIVQQSSTSTQARHSTNKGIDATSKPSTGLLSKFPDMGLKADRSTTGTGSATASTSLQDQITVKVVEMLPNGNLRVEGERAITLEKDKQSLIFQGTIRPEDISPDNTISSILVADQRLTAKGDGPIAEKQRPGLLSRLLSFLW